MPNFVEIRLVISYLMHGEEFVKKVSTSRKERIIIVLTFVAVPLRLSSTENVQFLWHMALVRALPLL